MMLTVTLATSLLGSFILLRVLVTLRQKDALERFAIAPLIVLTTFSCLSESVLNPPQSFRIASCLLVVALCVLALAQQSEAEGQASVGVLTGVGVALVLFAVNVSMAPDASLTLVFGRLLPCIMWAFIAMLAATSRLNMSHVGIALAWALGVTAVLSLFVANAWEPCSKFKCGQFGGLFSGPFSSGNYFARLACLAILCAVFVGDQRLQKSVIACGLIILYATESRTSQLALLLALAVWYVTTRLRSAPLARDLISRTLPILAVLAGIWLIYSAEPSSFSNRGYIWTLGRNGIGDDWWFGKGIDTWTTDILARNFMHSEALLLLYGGGVVALAFYCTFMTVVGRRAARFQSGSALALVAFILVLGLTEIAWNPIGLDGTTLFGLPLLVIAATTSAHPPAIRGDEPLGDRPNWPLRTGQAPDSKPTP